MEFSDRSNKLTRHFIEIDRSIFAWLVLLSIGFHVVTGDRDALVELSSGVGMFGHYSSLGPDSNVVSGLLHEVTGNCTKKFIHSVPPDDEPIGILFLPEVDESKSQKETSTTCSILEQVKQVMLLGCSALVVLALHPSLLKELDGSQIFSKPVVKVSSKQNVETMKKELKSSGLKKAVIIPVVKKKKEPDIMSIPKLTLWSTCGKSSGGTHRDQWEGTVCLGPNQFNSPISFSTLWQYAFSFIVSMYVIAILRKSRRPHQLEDVENSLQRLAKLSISKMPTKKYKRKRMNPTTLDSENCAICLDDFSKGQVIRMLPCYHQFHCKCVDDWLIKRRTCPLCKMDIVDQRFHCFSCNSQLA